MIRRWNNSLPIGKGFRRNREKRTTVVEFARKAGRTATGELALFRELYEEQRGRCAITGEPLLPPADANFYKQGSHILPKGAYGRARLWRCNVVLVLKSEHDRWEAEKNKEKLVEQEPRWKPYAERYAALRLYYNTTDGREEPTLERDGTLALPAPR